MSGHDEQQVRAFWVEAQVRAHFNPVHAYTGPGPREALPPPVFSFGTDSEGDELLERVLAGDKTATATALRDYEAAGEELPREGALAIVTDSAGTPRALLETTAVRVVPFVEVDAEHAAAEGEGDGSLEDWRAVHRELFGESAGESQVPDDLPVVLERFRVLYQDRPVSPLRGSGLG